MRKKKDETGVIYARLSKSNYQFVYSTAVANGCNLSDVLDSLVEFGRNSRKFKPEKKITATETRMTEAKARKIARFKKKAKL